jgi:hypothetical protein
MADRFKNIVFNIHHYLIERKGNKIWLADW